jgi:hypothetical protein
VSQYPDNTLGFNLGKKTSLCDRPNRLDKIRLWRSNLDAHFFIWDKKDVVYTVRIGLIKDGFWWSNLWVSNWVFPKIIFFLAAKMI